MTAIECLLAETADILQSQRIRRESTGEGYNFFTALCSFHDENRHSHFLHSLLNPRGAHLQKDLFLRLFLTELGVSVSEEWRLDHWRVEKEVTFSDSKRRIDLLLQGPEAIIGIENKVFAGEGQAQLSSYAQSLLKLCAGRPATLVFLTPSGRDPESNAALSSVDLVCCGYGHRTSPSLFGWLEACRDAVADKPRLVEVIQQYAEMADRIGGNTMKKQELEPLVRLINNRPQFEAAMALTEALAEAKVHAQVAFWQGLHARLGASGAPTLQIWPHKGVTLPDDKVVRGYYGTSRERPNPGLVYDTGLRWNNHILVLVLELLAKFGSRPNLTWKLQLRGDGALDKVISPEGDLALSELSARLCALAPALKASSWSLATGDLVLPDGSTLDVTDFRSGKALELLDITARPQVLEAVAQAVKDLVRRAGEIDGITVCPPR
jgi:PD-(D/E)XK nuclease superfamily